MLADVSGMDLDEILDSDLNQGQVILALREELAGGEVIPAHVIARKRKRQAEQQQRPPCRMCGVEGKSTKHHFVNRWLMRELENYDAYSARRICTIPICRDCHDSLHDRGTDAPGKSIVPYLKPHEAELAHRMLTDLREQRPRLFDLIAAGNEFTYEYVLIQDFIHGEFSKLAASSTGSVEVPITTEAVV
jgi:hypothetical protein